jgi:hypothetical protein
VPMTIASGPCIQIHDTNASQAQLYGASLQAQVHQHDIDAREREASGRLGLEAARLGQQQSQWAQEPQRQIDTTLAINQGRLSQQEELENLRMQNQIGAIRSAVNDGTISQEDAARHILKLQTGVDYYATRNANQQAQLQQQQMQHMSMQNQLMTGMTIQANQARSAGLASMTQYDYDPAIKERIQNDVRATQGHLTPAQQELEVRRRLHQMPGAILGRHIAEQGPNGGITFGYHPGDGTSGGSTRGTGTSAADQHQLTQILAQEAMRLHTEHGKLFNDSTTSVQTQKDAMAMAGITGKKWEDLTPEERRRAQDLHHADYVNRGVGALQGIINQNRPGAGQTGRGGGPGGLAGTYPTAHETMQSWSRDLADFGIGDRPVTVGGGGVGARPTTMPLSQYVGQGQQRIQALLSQSQVTDRDREEARNIGLQIEAQIRRHVPQSTRDERTNPQTQPRPQTEAEGRIAERQRYANMPWYERIFSPIGHRGTTVRP